MAIIDNTETQASLTQRVLPNIFAFLMGLGAAFFLKWETTDLVWSLWLSSLVVGYTTILATIASGAYVGLRAIQHEEFEAKYRTPAILAGTGAVLFFLGFFSLHFCGFHAGHSVFLSQFFPIEGMPKDGFGDAFMNPPLLWIMVFKHLMKPYGVFLIPVLIAERAHVFRPVNQAADAVREGGDLKENFKKRLTKRDGSKKDIMGDAMGRPYINVVRMHLLIFFFAFCHFLKADSFVIYAVVYVVYFFPWSEVNWPKKEGIKPRT